MLIFNDHYNSHYIEYFILIILRRYNHFAYIWLLSFFFNLCTEETILSNEDGISFHSVSISLLLLERTNGRKKKKMRERLNELIKNFIKKKKECLVSFYLPVVRVTTTPTTTLTVCNCVCSFYFFKKKKMNST
jgi:hypothetical protein